MVFSRNGKFPSTLWSFCLISLAEIIVHFLQRAETPNGYRQWMVLEAREDIEIETIVVGLIGIINTNSSGK